MSRNLGLSVSLKESNQQIEKSILAALLPEVSKYFLSKLDKIDDDISNLLLQSITSQPEYSSLLSGDLKAQFGIPDAQSRVQDILDRISSGRIVSIKKPSIVGNSIKGSISIKIVQSDFADLVGLGSASITTEKGTELNWLRWLLLEGDSIIISTHEFKSGNIPTSRTGLGFMSSGGSWRVPPQFAGNVKNNWITRAIDSIIPEIDRLISSKLKG